MIVEAYKLFTHTFLSAVSHTLVVFYLCGISLRLRWSHMTAYSLQDGISYFVLCDVKESVNFFVDSYMNNFPVIEMGDSY